MYPTYGLAEHTVFVCSGGSQVLNVDKVEMESNNRIVVLEDADADADADTGVKIVGCGFAKKQKVDIRIVNCESCELLGEDCVGEIWLRSDSKAGGYYGNEDATKEAFHAAYVVGGEEEQQQEQQQEQSGYLRTGERANERKMATTNPHPLLCMLNPPISFGSLHSFRSAHRRLGLPPQRRNFRLWALERLAHHSRAQPLPARSRIQRGESFKRFFPAWVLRSFHD